MVTPKFWLAIAALVLIGVVVVVEHRWRKGWEARTLYSRSYDEGRFKQTSAGEDAATVLARLGRPISARVRKNGGDWTIPGYEYQPKAGDQWTVLRYTEPKIGDNRVVRDVYLEGNKVTGIQADIFWD